MLAAFGLPHLFVFIKFTDVVWYFTLCCAVLFIVLLFSVLQKQFISEHTLHARQNPPSLKNYRQVIMFKNSLSYIKGLSFTFLFSPHFFFFLIHGILLKFL